MGCGAAKEVQGAVPETFPVGLLQEAECKEFYCWDKSVHVGSAIWCHPKTDQDVVDAVNWAAENGYKARATGYGHNWSPITVQNGDDKTKYVLISLMAHMNDVTNVTPAKGDEPPTATLQLGIKHADFLHRLENAAGGNGNIGFGINHTPAPPDITMGGILAIDGHGTSIPTEHEAKFNDPAKCTYGTYSNRMLKCKAVVWDEATKKYALKEFTRASGDIAPFLAHVGNAILTEATLQVDPNYYLRCQSFFDYTWETLFPNPGVTEGWENPKEHSMIWWIKKTGRAETIWFPFTDKPWLKVWTVTDEKCPEGARRVDTPCNYPFSDELPDYMTAMFRSLLDADDDKKKQKEKDEAKKKDGAKDAQAAQKDLDAKKAADMKEVLEKEKQTMKQKKAEHIQPDASQAEHETSWFEKLATSLEESLEDVVARPSRAVELNQLIYMRCVTASYLENARDLWGPSKNTLLYCKSTTLKVTANGYTVMTSRQNLEKCMYEFCVYYRDLLAKYRGENKYPISCPLEIRVTGLDDPLPIGGPAMNADTVPLSAMGYDEEAKKNGWDVGLWFDVLSLPGAPDSNTFYTEMEEWFMKNPTYNGVLGRIRPEWSKGWGYSNAGPWTNKPFLDHTRQTMPRWNEMMRAFKQHDPKRVISNPWMESFFSEIPETEKKSDEAKKEETAAPAPAPKVDESMYDLRTRAAVVAARGPIGVKVEKGKTYYWCTCGKSKNQPFCDGSHQGSEFAPMAWTADEDKEVYLCACKQTKNAPFCDGSHANLAPPA